MNLMLVNKKMSNSQPKFLKIWVPWLNYLLYTLQVYQISSLTFGQEPKSAGTPYKPFFTFSLLLFPSYPFCLPFVLLLGTYFCPLKRTLQPLVAAYLACSPPTLMQTLNTLPLGSLNPCVTSVVTSVFYKCFSSCVGFPVVHISFVEKINKIIEWESGGKPPHMGHIKKRGRGLKPFPTLCKTKREKKMALDTQSFKLTCETLGILCHVLNIYW